MNKLAIIGSLGRDPELRSTPNGIPVCTFSVGVTRRKSNEAEPQTDWFKVTAWRQMGVDLEECFNDAYQKIKRRQGKNVNGVFVKSTDGLDWMR